MRALHRVAILLIVLLASGAGLLWAHASLVRSDPARDARLPWPPRGIHLVFSENVTAATSRIDLVGPDSQRFQLVVRRDSGGNAKALMADVPSLAIAGRYRVEWRLIGPDGHAVTGRYSFAIDSVARAEAVKAPPALPRLPADDWTARFAPGSPLQAGIRFLWSGAVMLILGAMAFSRFVLDRLPDVEGADAVRAAAQPRLAALAASAAWVLLVLAALRLIGQSAVLAGSVANVRLADFVTVAIASSWGRGWMVFTAGVMALLILLRVSRRISGWVVAVGVVLAAAAPFLGHPAAAERATLAIGLDAVHVVAAGGWAGSVLVMTFVALPESMLLPAGLRTITISAMLQAFSPLALTCAALLLVTGGAGALLQLGTLPALWSSEYGVALIRKLVLVMVVAALGAWHWRVARPSLGSERSVTALRWSTAFDVLAVIGVLVLTAILTGTAPPTDVP